MKDQTTAAGMCNLKAFIGLKTQILRGLCPLHPPLGRSQRSLGPAVLDSLVNYATSLVKLNLSYKNCGQAKCLYKPLTTCKLSRKNYVQMPLKHLFYEKKVTRMAYKLSYNIFEEKSEIFKFCYMSSKNRIVNDLAFSIKFNKGVGKLKLD